MNHSEEDQYASDNVTRILLCIVILLTIVCLIVTVSIRNTVIDISDMLSTSNAEASTSDIESSTETGESLNPSISETEETIHIDETVIPETPSESTPVGGSSSEAPSAPITEEITPVIDPDELEMLACVIYQEAGGNECCDKCRYRVADVVLNRITHKAFPDTMYDVLTQYKQYGRFYWTGIKWPERAKDTDEAYAVERAYKVAEDVLTGKHSTLYGKGYIWQAEFVQGRDGFWCCGTYFGR